MSTETSIGLFWTLLTLHPISPLFVKNLCDLLDRATLRNLSACARNTRALDNSIVVKGHNDAIPALPNFNTVAFRLVLKEGVGWALETMQYLNANQPLIAYTGEYISSSEAARREKYKRVMTYQLVNREHMPDVILTTIIDASNVGGGYARFVNNSCNGNLRIDLFRQSRNQLLPVPLLVTTRNIAIGEELTFSYDNGEHLSSTLSTTVCRCGSVSCRGFLPRTLY